MVRTTAKHPKAVKIATEHLAVRTSLAPLAKEEGTEMHRQVRRAVVTNYGKLKDATLLVDVLAEIGLDRRATHLGLIANLVALR